MVSITFNALDGKLQEYNNDRLTNADAPMTTVDVSKIEVPTYLMYAMDANNCPAEAN